MFRLKRIVLFLCIASGLTLSVNNELKTDGASENIFLNLNNLKTSSILTTVPSTNIGEPKAKDVNVLHTEGGTISNLSSMQLAMTEQTIIPTNDTLVVVKNISTERNVTQSKAGNNDTSSPVLDRKRGHLMPDPSTVNDENQNIETNVTIKEDHVNLNNSNNKNVNKKIDDKSKQLSNTSVVPPEPNILEKKFHNSTTITMPLSSKHKPNPKPTVTMGGGAADPNKPIPPSPTKSSPLGMPQKIDYIIPIAITVLALPILGVTTYILYNRGKDCWDKRHYRRMDFLIDGMYND